MRLASEAALSTMKNTIPTILIIVAIGVLNLLVGSAYAMTHQKNSNVWTFGNLTGSGQPQDQMTEAQKLFNQNQNAQTWYAMAKSNPHYVITERPVTDEDRGIGNLAGGGGGSVAQWCTVIWQAVDPTHPEQGGPGGCF